jgi:hypothetical protein
MPVQQTASPNTAENAAAVVPHDSTNQAVAFRALWIGVGGNVSIAFSDGTSATFVGVPAGSMLPVGGVRVNATGTTASSILAVY